MSSSTRQDERDGTGQSPTEHADVVTPAAPGARPLWIRLPVMAVVFGLVTAGANAVTAAAGASALGGLVVGIAAAAVALLLYVGLVRVLERRPVGELRLSGLRSRLGWGTVAGLALFTTTIGLIAVLGGYRLTGWGSIGALATLGLMVAVATTEEILFRGVVFRLIEERAGTWIALALSSVLFGALHLLNPDASLWGALAVAVEAGALLGAVYVLTRSLWAAIGVHLGWNVAEAGVFGAGVSGSGEELSSVLVGAFTGSPVLTGGSFGPEASLLALLVCAVPTVVLLRLAVRRGRVQGPRRRVVAGPDTDPARPGSSD
jgi:hypothetical protein